MSISELIVVIVVVIIIIKPEDLPSIIKQIKKTRRFFYKIKDEVLESINPNLTEEDDDIETEDINKYITKIISLNAKYEGSYNLKDVKSFYYKLLRTHNRPNSR